MLKASDGRAFVVASELADQLVASVPLLRNAMRIGSDIDGHMLEAISYKFPFDDEDAANANSQPSTGKECKQWTLVPSEHVTASAGTTGLVHIAPALGQDDFKLGIRHRLPTECVIDELGRYSRDDPLLSRCQLHGLPVLGDATTDRIRHILGTALVHEHTHTHSYPYDWRTKKPCIIRSSMQWFIDTQKLKDAALRALADVRIRPSNVTNSMLTTLSSRQVLRLTYNILYFSTRMYT